MNTLEYETSLYRENAIKGTTLKFLIPLYMLFGLLDYIYYQEFFLNFLYLRIAGSFFIALLSLIYFKNHHIFKTQLVATFIIQIFSQSVIYMLFLINDFTSPYYMGISMVFLIFDIIFRLSWSFFFFNIFLISLPIAALLIPNEITTQSDFNYLHIFFIIFYIVTASILKKLNFNLFNKEYTSRKLLDQEIKNRDITIQKKVDEIIEINDLAKQFSPQVLNQMEKIQKGELLEESINKQICVLFVDIVDSTKKINKLSHRDFNLSLTKFMELTTNTLLHHEITIDKFLGDGFLAFSNAPFSVENFVQKVVLASIHINRKIFSNQQFFEKHWGGDFSTRIGIDKGEAKVGFIGTHELFKTYSAIGPAVNRASRLCSIAKKNEILITSDVFKELKNMDFLKSLKVETMTNIKIEGFEKNIDDLYSLSDFESLKPQEIITTA